ncbi:MAG: hypothetical protein IKH26_09070 [Bacteroidaceae bacterium]|nr:hypothetical protein [Bacteroidaceae bacterium]
MRKFLILLVAVLLPLCASAQKKYVNVVATGLQDRYQSLTLSGDLPSDMKSFYDSYTDRNTVGNVINHLVSLGYVVEQMSCAYGEKSVEVVLLSKSTSPDLTQVRGTTMTEQDGNVVEVARYNLQGIPVRPNEKGVQIVVYSNYTTRTVIVE